MILPSKGITQERALLTIAAQVSLVLTEPMTVSQAWEGFKVWRNKNHNVASISFAWFSLALDLLYAMDAIQIHDGLLHKVARR